MIISASRRTDIPSFYSEWFYNRLREGCVLVRNPMNYHQVGRISLSPEAVDGIVFWTKNPIPMMGRLSELDGYHYYFQFTLTAYGRDIEPGLPSKNERLIPAFLELSRRTGRERVVWRYDPIFLSETYTLKYHLRYFKVLAERLAPYTESCTVSFLDLYRNIEKALRLHKIRVPSHEEQLALMGGFSRIAKANGLRLDTCAEEGDFGGYGVGHAHCIDRERLERIGGFRLDVKKDPGQREACGCVSSIDIGAYHTCRNGCIYCYANQGRTVGPDQTGRHDPGSPLLVGKPGAGDVIKEREAVSYADRQMSLFL
ncbi:MAG: DUF1848 domain-containing protein [Lachnospiraceae bacterium]|nr:DUF1848 domain-containing protein [Lachnospiraceae bacterium]